MRRGKFWGGSSRPTDPPATWRLRGSRIRFGSTRPTDPLRAARRGKAESEQPDRPTLFEVGRGRRTLNQLRTAAARPRGMDTLQRSCAQCTMSNHGSCARAGTLPLPHGTHLLLSRACACSAGAWTASGGLLHAGCQRRLSLLVEVLRQHCWCCCAFDVMLATAVACARGLYVLM